MELISKKSILIIAPSLIAESLSLKLTSLDQNLDINFNNGAGDKTPDLVIWNVLNFQSEDLIRLELLKLRERYDESKFLIILSGIKKEFISRLICKMLDELDNLIKNIKENYKEKDMMSQSSL